MYSIYLLKETESPIVKYIGLTKQDIKNRFIQHIYKAKGAKKKNKTQAWIISCLNSGISMEIELIENNIADIETATIRESYYIKLYRKINPDLKNETDGGNCAYDGSYWRGRKQTLDHSKKISNALKGRKPSRSEIEKSVKGMINKVYNGEDKKAIKIDQYDLEMNFIKTWPSIRRIAAETGLPYRGLWNNINGKRKNCHVYIWKKSKR